MSSAAAVTPGLPGVGIRGRRYPVLLPSVRDPRLHLAVVVVSLQVLGQVAFDFRLSIAQILVAVGTCAVLEFGIAFWRQRVLMWPASALLTGNGVAFVLRVPGTEHGHWWSLHGGWIFAGTAAGALLSKHALRLRGSHVFNPSNIGLVVCFLLLGATRAEPLDFWWGPMSAWMALALAIIVVGGLVILRRVGLLVIAVSFWLAFAAAIAVVAASGHAMTARWHLGPVEGFRFWAVLATSPEILVFLFFMLTDPKTTPQRTRGRIVYAVSVALLAALLVAPTRTEFWAKVAVLGALAIVCLGRGVLGVLPRTPSLRTRTLAIAATAALAAYAGLLVVAGIPGRPAPAAAAPPPPRGTPVPRIAILPSRGVDTALDPRLARRMAVDVAAEVERRRLPVGRLRRVTLWLEAGLGQGPVVVARLEGRSVETAVLASSRRGYSIARVRASRATGRQAP
jgi:Na+-translocating ferredoxin:NAD+ oxidoreductase RnfD subunit